MEFEGKVVVITGAANGIGLETAKLFASEGAKVVIVDIDESAGREAEAIMGKQTVFHKTDVGDVSQVQALFDYVYERYGKIDILFNNAGVESAKSVLETTEVDWDRVLRVNLKGVFFCSQAAARYMVKEHRGAIVHTASELGLVGSPNNVAYTASKGGVVNMAKSMALDLAPFGIRVNCVCPGATDTGMLRRDLAKRHSPEQALEEIIQGQPLGRLGQPIDVAHAVVFLASDRARYITGVALPVDGGYTAQ